MADTDDVTVKRTAVASVYSGASWQDRVKKMSSNQIIALYFRFKNEGKIK